MFTPCTIKMILPRTMDSVLSLGYTSIGIITIILVWNFLDEIVGWLITRFVEYVMSRYVLAPERYASYVQRVMNAVLPHVSMLMPFLRPLIAGDSVSIGRRVSDRIEVSYVYRDSNYVFIMPYTERPGILKAMARMENNAELDITERVRKYAGPCIDFSGYRCTANDILRGTQAITITYNNGQTSTVL